jgi:hypothetical protein
MRDGSPLFLFACVLGGETCSWRGVCEREWGGEVCSGRREIWMERGKGCLGNSLVFSLVLLRSRPCLVSLPSLSHR